MAHGCPNRLPVCLAACSDYHFAPTALEGISFQNAARKANWGFVHLFIFFLFTHLRSPGTAAL